MSRISSPIHLIVLTFSQTIRQSETVGRSSSFLAVVTCHLQSSCHTLYLCISHAWVGVIGFTVHCRCLSFPAFGWRHCHQHALYFPGSGRHRAHTLVWSSVCREFLFKLVGLIPSLEHLILPLLRCLQTLRRQLDSSWILAGENLFPLPISYPICIVANSPSQVWNQLHPVNDSPLTTTFCSHWLCTQEGTA